MPEHTGDSPIERADIRTMSIEQATQWLEGIRERRMKLRQKYEIVERAKSTARVDKVSEKLEKAMLLLMKKLTTIDAKITAAEVATLKCQAMTMEIEHERSEYAGAAVPDDGDRAADDAAGTNADE